MVSARHTTMEGTALRRKLGLPVPVVILLAAIAAIRVPLHDLGIVPEGSVVAGLLVFVPQAVWLVVVLRRRVGGNFEGVLAPGLESLIVRGFAFFSSIVTGTLVGTVVGAVAWVIGRLRRT